MMPVITIITACLNSERLLEKTIESVIGQTYPYIEYIIIDGGSTDGTLKTINGYKNHVTKLISEPDEGVYDAMNKGIINATGDIIYFLNAGDSLYSETTLEDVATVFQDESVFAVYGNVEVINDYKKKKEVRGCMVSFTSLLYSRICHQAFFVRKFLFDEMGLFSTEFKLSADHDFIVRCIKKYPNSFIYKDSTIAMYRDGGMSCKNMEKTKKEDLAILYRNYSFPHALFGAIVCFVVVLKYKIPHILRFKSASFE